MILGTYGTNRLRKTRIVRVETWKILLFNFQYVQTCGYNVFTNAYKPFYYSVTAYRFFTRALIGTLMIINNSITFSQSQPSLFRSSPFTSNVHFLNHPYCFRFLSLHQTISVVIIRNRRFSIFDFRFSFLINCRLHGHIIIHYAYLDRPSVFYLFCKRVQNFKRNFQSNSPRL